jgi:hypothetical protein
MASIIAKYMEGKLKAKPTEGKFEDGEEAGVSSTTGADDSYNNENVLKCKLKISHPLSLEKTARKTRRT